MRLRARLIIFATALLLAFLSACSPLDSQEQAARPRILAGAAFAQDETAAQPAQQRQVRTITPKQGVLSTSRSTTVTVEPAQESLVAAGASGRVMALLRRAGEIVEAGEAVVQIDDRSLQLQVQNAQLAVESARVNLRKAQSASGEGAGQARAALTGAELNLDLAERQYRESQALHAAGGVSAADLTGLEAQLAQARASRQQAVDAVARSDRSQGEDLQLLQLQVRQAETQLRQAEAQLVEARVTAPFRGEVAATMVNPGEFIAAGSPAFRLVSVDEQLARFSVPPADAQRLVQQGIVYLRYNGLDYAAQVWPSEGIPGQARLVDLTATIYASEERIPTGTVTQLPYRVVLAEGLLLPVGALQTSGRSSNVFVVVDGRAERLPVNVLAESGGQAALSGLSAGSLVVYPVPADLRSGTRVKVLPPVEGR